MGVVKLSQSGLRNYAKYSSMLAGNGAFSPSSYDLLTTTTLTSSAASVTFSGLGSYSGYKHLQIRYMMRLNSGFDGGTVQFRLNGDSANNYSYHQLIGGGASVLSQAASNQTMGQAGYGIGGNAPANVFGAGVLEILDFSATSKNTTTRSLSGRVGAANSILLTSSLWVNTAAVTSIELSPYFGDSMVTGSRFSLYGLK